MRHHGSWSRGYTLRDLLIVIFIISVLLALLLPLIQAGRARARRTECHNNLKWIVIGLQNYHDTYKVFPAGAMHAGPHPQAEPPNDSKLGPSWWYGIVPFMIQSNVYDGIQATQTASASRPTEFCADDMIAARITWTDNSGALISQFAGIDFDFMRCPASPLPVFETKTGPICLPTYVGIAGGCDIDPASLDYANATPLAPAKSQWVFCNPAKGTGAVPGGIVTSSGMLPPCENRSMADCLDGTSNTIIVGEQSDWLRDDSHLPYHGDPGWTVGGTGAGGGWLSGTRRCDPVPQLDVPGGAPAPWGADCWNITTVRYPPNTKRVLGPQPLPGCSENHGINNPLQSPHPDGVLVAFVDGSVQFVDDSLELHILLRTAIRNDGQNISRLAERPLFNRDPQGSARLNETERSATRSPAGRG